MKMKARIMKTISIATTVLVSVLGAGLAAAQNPSIIQNTRQTMNGVSNRQTAASNQVLGVRQSAPTAAQARTTPAHVPVHPVPAAAISVKSVAPKRAAVKHVPGARNRRGAYVDGAIMVPVPAAVPDQPAPADASAESNIAPGGEGESAAGEQSVVPDSKYAANGRRDPFISPVVSRAGGSGCSTGKKCLEIGAINLRGVVHAESGFIAVVSNGLNKAYFLRENDPVFNGYVVKITGDSIVFQETLQDRLGKTFTREVVKKITTPAV
jgi:hypothetical protein